jgi:hypothetical protein
MAKKNEVKVTVLKRHYYGGVTYDVGESYMCARQYFSALQAIGRVTEFVEPPKPKSKPRSSSPAARGRTRTANLNADLGETSEAATDDTEASTESDEEPKSGTSRYRTRVMTPEDE